MRWKDVSLLYLNLIIVHMSVNIFKSKMTPQERLSITLEQTQNSLPNIFALNVLTHSNTVVVYGI